jgi:DNA-binding MarR family transcriptional regulator
VLERSGRRLVTQPDLNRGSKLILSLRTQGTEGALSRQTPEVEAWAQLLRAHAALTRRFSTELLAEHGLTLNDYEVLLHLAHAPERRLRRVDLAESILLTPSGITRLLDGLERGGYVARAACAEDARVTYAVLTDGGYEKLREAAPMHLGGIRELFGQRYSKEELALLASLLERLPAPAAPECEPPNATD